MTSIVAFFALSPLAWLLIVPVIVNAMYSQLTHLLSDLRAGNNEYQWKNIVFKAHEGVQERCRYLFCCFEGNRNGRSPPFTQSQHLSNRENVLYKLHLCRPYMSKCEQSGGFSVELCHICFLLPLILCWIMDSKEGLGRSKQND